MVSDLVFAIRLLIAAVLGGLIGFEREIHGRAAGLRTHILVCVGSALMMLTSIHMISLSQGGAGDPGRIAAQVVSGIGFLGAGTIMRFKASIKGLTTAASLWAAAGVGLAVGSGLYFGAFSATAIMLVVLVYLRRFERQTKPPVGPDGEEGQGFIDEDKA